MSRYAERGYIDVQGPNGTLLHIIYVHEDAKRTAGRLQEEIAVIRAFAAAYTRGDADDQGRLPASNAQPVEVIMVNSSIHPSTSDSRPHTSVEVASRALWDGPGKKTRTGIHIYANNNDLAQGYEGWHRQGQGSTTNHTNATITAELQEAENHNFNERTPSPPAAERQRTPSPPAGSASGTAQPSNSAAPSNSQAHPTGSSSSTAQSSSSAAPPKSQARPTVPSTGTVPPRSSAAPASSQARPTGSSSAPTQPKSSATPSKPQARPSVPASGTTQPRNSATPSISRARPSVPSSGTVPPSSSAAPASSQARPSVPASGTVPPRSSATPSKSQKPGPGGPSTGTVLPRRPAAASSSQTAPSGSTSGASGSDGQIKGYKTVDRKKVPYYYDEERKQNWYRDSNGGKHFFKA